MQHLRPYISERFKTGFILLVILTSIEFWSFRGVNEKIFELLKVIASLSIVTIVLFNMNSLLKKGHFKINILLFLLLPILSVIGAGIFHDHPVGLSLWMYRTYLFWLFYFVLHIFDVPPQKIYKLMIFVGIVWIFLTVAQQFTYPKYYFYSRDDKGDEEILRAGVYRYFINGSGYGTFLLCFSFYGYLIKKKNYLLILTLIALVGVYYTGIRQAAGAAIGCLVVAIFLLKGPDKWKYLVMFTGLSLLVALVGSFLFSEVLEMTQSQVDNKDYVRYLSADFFLNEYWPHWSAKLLGNGPGHGTTPYGKEIEYYQMIFGYYGSDVGIIGVYNQLGVFYVLNILFVNLKGVFSTINQREGKFLKLFFFQGLFLILLSVGYTNPSGMVFYSIIYYLFEKVALADDNSLKPLVHSRPFRKAFAS